MITAYIRIRCYCERTRQTLFYLLTGRKPDLSNMHVFGTTCFRYEQNKLQLDAHCSKGIFVEYDRRSLAYLVYYPNINEIRKLRRVKFLENVQKQHNKLEDKACNEDHDIDICHAQNKEVNLERIDKLLNVTNGDVQNDINED